MIRFVIYTRIAYEDQGQPDSSLATQCRDIDFYLGNYAQGAVVEHRFSDQLVADGRPLLGIQAALSECRKSSATLLVAHLDRLPFLTSGYAPFFADPNISLRVAVLPLATKTELSIHARLQAQERSFHARQAIANLDANTAERRCRPLIPENGPKQQSPDQIAQIILPMRQRGATLRDIASALNRAGLTTNSGTAWKPTQVSRLLQMMG